MHALLQQHAPGPHRHVLLAKHERDDGAEGWDIQQGSKAVYQRPDVGAAPTLPEDKKSKSLRKTGLVAGTSKRRPQAAHQRSVAFFHQTTFTWKTPKRRLMFAREEWQLGATTTHPAHASMASLTHTRYARPPHLDETLRAAWAAATTGRGSAVE